MKNNKKGALRQKGASNKQNISKDNTAKLPIRSNSFAAQTLLVRNALIAAGRKGVTTLELQETYGVVHPPARILNLRQRGFSILTRMEKTKDSAGRTHRVGRYFLIGRTKHGRQKARGVK